MDKDSLHDALTIYCIKHQYSQLCPPIQIPEFQGRDEKAVHLYNNNPFFHMAVRSLVSGIMTVIDDHLK